MYTATMILPILEWLGIRVFELVIARIPQRNEVRDDDDGQVVPRSPILPNTLVVSSGTETTPDATDLRGFTFKSGTGNAINNWTRITDVLSSRTYGDLWVDFSDDDSEAADDEDYEVMCDNCLDCIERNLARKNAKGHVPIIFDTTWSSGFAPDQGFLGPRGVQFRQEGASYNQGPIGSRLYKPWPLPVDDGRPIRNPHQGQQTKTRNVTEPVTPSIHGGAEDAV